MGLRRDQAAVAAGCVLAALLPVAAVLPGSSAGTRGVAAAAFPGDNGLIAFISDRGGDDDLFVVRPDGSGARSLVDTSAAESSPAWSPDGTSLVFARSDGEGGSALFVVDRDGTGERRVTPAGATDGDPAWSPEGGRIAFESDRGGGQTQIWVVDAAGGEPELLVPASEEGATFDPSWSPDGERIVYATTEADTDPAELWVVELDAVDDPVRLTSPPAGTDHRYPDWSPDGGRVVYATASEGGSGIASVRADGSAPLAITDDTGTDVRPSWSPDGQRIVFTRILGEGSTAADALWTVAADGSSEEQLTSGGGLDDDNQPSWGPVPPVTTVVVDPPSDARDVGDDTTVQVTATDRLGDPVEGADVLVRITGAHPQTAQLVTDEDGSATYTWESTRAGTDTVLVCADPDGDGTCDPADPAATASVMWSVPVADEPRLAFTDDTDALYTLDVSLPTASGDPPYRQVGPPVSFEAPVSGYRAGPTHEGEAGGLPGQPPAFVSTRDDPNGEVYLARIRDQAPVRVTCDPGTESHPVVAPGGAVAYASDADGDWDVYVSMPPPPEPPGRVAPFGRSAVPAAPAATAATACDDDWETLNLTDEPDGTPLYDDLWPTWTYTGASTGGAQRDGIAFSRAAEGGLPDLYRVVGADRVFVPPVALTSTDDVAETQPAGMALVVRSNTGCTPPCLATYTGRGWLAFTTTDVRSSGSIALLAPDDPDTVLFPEGSFLQASEPAWSDVANPTHLAVSTTRNDPYGGVAIAEVEQPEPLGTPPAVRPSDPEVGATTLLSGVGPSGTTVSHPHWLDGFGIEDPQGTLVVTARSDGEVDEEGRVLQADVSDVRATDGTQRRVLRHERVLENGQVVYRFDEAGPSYSPDGRRFVYSRTTGQVNPSVSDARVLMVADADGSNAAPLLPPALRFPGDLDVDPVWSPDGARVAFVRVTGRDDPEEEREPPEVHVYDLDAGTLVRVPGAGGAASADLSPSWAPDSRHLVLARSAGGSGVLRDAARRWDTGPPGSGPRLVVVDVDRPLDPALTLDSCGDGCVISGRSPAWSPDGATIAYESDGELRTVALTGTCCGPSWSVADPVTVIGFDNVTREPTPSRTVVESAQDPAWSPDGSEIAFTGQPVGQPDHRGIWRIAPDGADPRLVTDEPGPESEPAYQDRRDADVAVTVTVVDSPAPVGAPILATFVVTNLGPRPAPLVSLDVDFAAGALTAAPGAPAGCRTDGTGCDLAVLAPGESRVYPVRVRHSAPLMGVATGTVTADAPDPDAANNVDSAPYRVMDTDVLVRIAVDDPVGYVGGLRTARVTVRNVGGDPVEDVELRATWSADVDAFVPPVLPPPAAPSAPPCLVAGTTCMLGTLGPGSRRTFRVGLETRTEGIAVLAAEVTTSTPELDLENNEDETELEILLPSLQLLPSVAPPGKVVLAFGENMPPGSRVVLTWDPGITTDRRLIRVAPDGTLRMPVLVVRRDLLGERVLVATSRTDLFTPVDGDLLVVPRTLAPPSFNGRG